MIRSNTILAAFVGSVAAIGCAQRTDAPASALSRTALCTDSVEEKAITCSGQTVRRSGDTLYIRLESGRDTTIANLRQGEIAFDYKYVGRFGRPTAHLIRRFGGEQPPQLMVLHPRTGALTDAPGWPVLSPDSQRFAATDPLWACAAEFPEQILELWRLTDTATVREWKLAAMQCSGNGEATGWATVGPQWRGNDTLEFTQLELTRAWFASRRRAAMAVRDSSGWRLLPFRLAPSSSSRSPGDDRY